MTTMCYCKMTSRMASERIRKVQKTSGEDWVGNRAGADSTLGYFISTDLKAQQLDAIDGGG